MPNGFTFLDVNLILEKMDKASRKVLMIQAGKLRKTAQREMRPGGKKGAVSQPGEPPRYHSNPLLRKRLYFGWDENTGSVVVGPEELNTVNPFSLKPKGTVPHVMEFGGVLNILQWFRAGEWQRADLRSKRRIQERRTRVVSIPVEERPYMKPAFKKIKPTIAAGYSNVLR